jgi:hypothetical protein
VSFVDPKRPFHSLVRLTILAVSLVVAFSCVICYVSNLPPEAKFELLGLLLLLSLMAYKIREMLVGRPRRQGAPRGAERTPLLPPVQEEE